MAVDYRLLPTFQASRRRHDAARRALPDRWRSDPRPEVQAINDNWVAAVARAREHLDRIAASRQGTSPLLDDR
jgi:acyl-CoA reductase-like NAD-dependent aldehyde dehydrogenase